MNNLKKKINLIIIIGIVFIIIISLFFATFFYQQKAKYLYEINLKDNIIKVTKNKIYLNGENLNFSSENVQDFLKLLKENYPKDSKLSLDYSKLNSYDEDVFSSILAKSSLDFSLAIVKYLYEIDLAYHNSHYLIYLQKNNEIYVQEVKLNPNGDITKILNSYYLKFTKENTTKVYNYLLTLFNDNSHELIKMNVFASEKNIFDSIIYDSEEYLNSEEIHLLATLSYNGLNCLTPVLYLYDNNTYEYYYTFTTDSSELVPITGHYDLDLSLLLNEITYDYNGYYYEDFITKESYYLNPFGYYTNNILSETNSNLITCLVQGK